MCLAIPGKIVEISGSEPLSKTARVSFGGVVKTVSLAYVPEVEIGDYVVVHVGFALSKIDEDAARETLADLQQIANLN